MADTNELLRLETVEELQETMRQEVKRLHTALVTILGQASAFKELNAFAADSVSEIQAAQETGALIQETAMTAIKEANRG